MKQLFLFSLPLFSLGCTELFKQGDTGINNNQPSWDFTADGAASWKGEAAWHRSFDGIVEQFFLRGEQTFFVKQYHDQEGNLRATYWHNIPDRWGGGHCLFDGAVIPSESQLSIDISGEHCLWIDDTPGGEEYKAEERWTAKEGSLLIATELNGAESAPDWQNYYAWSVRAEFTTTWHQFIPDSDEPGLVKYGNATINQDGFFVEGDINFGRPELAEASCPQLEECWSGYLEPTITNNGDPETCEAVLDWLIDEGYDYASYTILDEGKEIYKPSTTQTIQAARRFDTCTTTFIDDSFILRIDEGNGSIFLAREGEDIFVTENNIWVTCRFRFEGELSPCD